MIPQSVLRAYLEKNLNVIFLPDNAAWINRFRVLSSDDKTTYIFAQRRNLSEWGCSCKGWIYNRNCYHLTTMMELFKVIEKEHKKNKRIKKK